MACGAETVAGDGGRSGAPLELTGTPPTTLAISGLTGYASYSLCNASLEHQSTQTCTWTTRQWQEGRMMTAWAAQEPLEEPVLITALILCVSRSGVIVQGKPPV